MKSSKLLIAASIVAWSGLVVAAYFVAQKPFALQIADPLMKLAWTLVVTSILLGNALALGLFTVRRFISDLSHDASTLALASGIGLGELGILGFVLAATGASSFFILLIAQLLLLGWSVWSGTLSDAFARIKIFFLEVRTSTAPLPSWMKWATLLTIILTFLRTLLPPADGFDALLYHLRVPELWLQDGGLRAYNIPHYWFPSLVEGIYFWGLGLGSEIVSHQIHFAYALCVMMLLWHWTRRLWGDLPAGWAITLLISMPSVFLLASWAYTDLALIFFGLAMLYTLARGQEQNDPRWWTLSAISAGMAMGVKYTSFFMPLTAVLLLAIWNFKQKGKLFQEILKFGFVSAATGLIWYLRNWIWMGNPVYPFVLGGQFWDLFRAAWYAGAGTGLGWDFGALLLLPLTITMGHQDVNSIDGDIGPLLLLALPLALWTIVRRSRIEPSSRIPLTAITVFCLFGASLWVYGYITTRNLWQTRLLLPVLVPFLIPASVGMAALPTLNTKQFRISFIVSGIAAISIFVNLLDVGLSVMSRNPLAIAAGLVTKESYLERYQPGYAYALEVISQAPQDANVYALFEPRSYKIPRTIQPDPILDNFSHDVFLYKNPEDIVQAWRRQGYTHVLLNRTAAEAILGYTGEMDLFESTVHLLRPVSVSPDENYEFFEIPE